MHPELTIAAARHAVRQRAAEAERRHRLGVGRRRGDVRAALGRTLLRWGARLAPAAGEPAGAPASGLGSWPASAVPS